MGCHSVRVPVGRKQLPRGQQTTIIGLSILFSVWIVISVASVAWGTDPAPKPESGIENALSFNDDILVVKDDSGKVVSFHGELDPYQEQDQGKYGWPCIISSKKKRDYYPHQVARVVPLHPVGTNKVRVVKVWTRTNDGLGASSIDICESLGGVVKFRLKDAGSSSPFDSYNWSNVISVMPKLYRRQSQNPKTANQPDRYTSEMSVAPSAGTTDPVPKSESEGEALVLTPVRELHQGNAKNETIIDGKIVNTNLFPVSFLLKSSQDRCTWFLVGAGTLMTAAHCVSEDTLIKIEEEGGGSFEARCERCPKFPSDQSQDWALCSLTTDYPPPIIGNSPPGFYEVLNTDPSALKKNDVIIITGFGCTRPGGTLDNIYRAGPAKIDGLPPDVLIRRSTKLTPNVYEINGLPSCLCEGDSGGPAFEMDKTFSFRRVIGINSKTINKHGQKIGYLASTSTKDALFFFNDWAKRHNKKICGLHKDAMHCRPTKP